jgi:hypothetical protein
MRRASQLRDMLLFLARAGLTDPYRPLREHDIACGVLGRHDNFDPAYDNIVRVQAGHLRRKLDEYYSGEGASEHMRLRIPKGSYLPVFEENIYPQPRPEADEPHQGAPVEAAHLMAAPLTADNQPAADRDGVPKGVAGISILRWFLATLLLLATTGAILFGVRKATPSNEDLSLASRMLPFLRQHGGDVTVVLPDTSLLLVQKLLDTEIPLDAYTKSSYPQDLAAMADSVELQRALELLGRVRTTTLNEAEAGMDYQQLLKKSGFETKLRYSRDLRVSDLGVGNYILIGNQRSNPWVSLFAKSQNFQFTATPDRHNYLFRNLAPGRDEPNEYLPIDTPRESTNYVDIMLTPNLTDSGYMLLIVGSDVPGNEAAVRFLLRGEIPQQLQTTLLQSHLKSLEILLRGHHLHGESNDTIEVVSFRMHQR